MLQTVLSPAVSPGIFPDPALSANVYCSGRLDEVIARLVAPFWRQAEPGSSYLWFMRYARCGEHLKIRLHAPEPEAARLRDQLQAAQEEYFLSSAAPPPGSGRRSTPTAPPIDAEDWATVDHPDRTFLWTTYGRSHLSLGYRPFLDDDGYAALATRCLGAGAEIVLARFATGPDGECPFAVQREIWREALLNGLLAASFSARDRALYLLYHRDCLLRYLRKRKGWVEGASAMGQVLAQFDRQPGRQELQEELAGAMAAVAPGGAETVAWKEALGALSGYVAPLLADPAYHVDPFADHPAFPVFFKIFHGVANQIGLDATNEAFLYHSLAGITAEADLRLRPVRLKPHL